MSPDANHVVRPKRGLVTKTVAACVNKAVEDVNKRKAVTTASVQWNSLAKRPRLEALRAL